MKQKRTSRLSSLPKFIIPKKLPMNLSKFCDIVNIKTGSIYKMLKHFPPNLVSKSTPIKVTKEGVDYIFSAFKYAIDTKTRVEDAIIQVAQNWNQHKAMFIAKWRNLEGKTDTFDAINQPIPVDDEPMKPAGIDVLELVGKELTKLREENRFQSEVILKMQSINKELLRNIDEFKAQNSSLSEQFENCQIMHHNAIEENNKLSEQLLKSERDYKILQKNWDELVDRNARENAKVRQSVETNKSCSDEFEKCKEQTREQAHEIFLLKKQIYDLKTELNNRIKTEVGVAINADDILFENLQRVGIKSILDLARVVMDNLTKPRPLMMGPKGDHVEPHPWTPECDEGEDVCWEYKPEDMHKE